MNKSHRIYTPLWIFFIGVIILVVSLMLPQAADAQCGSSASSCKNCHEVQAEYPVNASGDWHVSHAFGDFCEFCHAGNVQATEQDAAHQGMVYPLDDINAGCLSCHPDDVNEVAEVYAVALGVTVGTGGDDSGGPTAGDGGTNDTAVSGEPAAEPEAEVETETAGGDGAIIDFNRQYEQTVLNEREPINVGNAILTVLAVGFTAVGAVLIWRWEGLDQRWRELRGQPAVALSGDGTAVLNAPPASQVPTTSPNRPSVKPTNVKTSPQITTLAEQIANLHPDTVRALTQLLERPQHGEPIIRAVARLDVQLVTAVRRLDPTDRELLLALVRELDKAS